MFLFEILGGLMFWVCYFVFGIIAVTALMKYRFKYLWKWVAKGEDFYTTWLDFEPAPAFCLVMLYLFWPLVLFWLFLVGVGWLSWLMFKLMFWSALKKTMTSIGSAMPNIKFEKEKSK